MNEARARLEIAAYCARLYERHLVAGTSGNVSLRLDDGTLLVTPSGRSLGDLGPADLVVCAADGHALEGGPRPSSELPLHVAAYSSRADIACVVHTHPTYCTAWSKTGALFPLDSVGALESLGTIAFVPYARSGSRELAETCALALRSADTILMERHGLTSVAAKLRAALDRTDLAEATAHLEFAADLLRASNRRSMHDERPALPLHEFHAAAGDYPEARAAIADFHAEYSAERPDAGRLHSNAERVRNFPPVAAAFERWWLDPRIVAFVAELNATGL